MKLFTRYSQATLFANIAIFLVASVAFYFSLHYVLVGQVDEDLGIEENEVVAFVDKYDRLPESFSFSDQIISFSKAAGPIARTIANVPANGSEPFRRLSFSIHATGRWYRVDVSKELEGTSKLLRSILIVSVITILLILLATAVINRVSLRRLWKPFYRSIEAVRFFRVSREQELKLTPTGIDEFQLLNEALIRLTRSSRLEYAALKTFSENASHELQTPIAIIRSKLDVLIQDEGLTQAQSDLLAEVYRSIEKLSRLNRSLLLLTKIENRQFENVETINLRERLENKCSAFQELWQNGEIRVQKNIGNAYLRIDRDLADILLNNLLSNATHHNLRGGHIEIGLEQARLSICNTGDDGALDSGHLFERFYRASPHSSHSGLGLSIVRQIADVSSLTLAYAYKNGRHCFIVTW